MKKGNLKLFIKRVASFLLAFVFVMTLIGGIIPSFSFAEENEESDYGWLIDPENDAVVEEPAIGEGVEVDNETEEEPIVGQGYRIDVNTYNVSFGKVYRDQEVEYYPLLITNSSTRDISLYWVESDPHQSVTVDAPDEKLLTVGASNYFYLKPNTSLPCGYYSSSLLIGDDSDMALQYGTTVKISFEVAELTPHIDSVSVTPGNITVARGSSQKYVADVRGENNPDTSVTWSISGQSSADTKIDSNGNLYVASGETASNISVMATSVQDPSFVGKANAMVVSADYSVSVAADPYEGGSVNGGGTVAAGEGITVLAAPNISYKFAGWYLDGQCVSNQAKYTHIANSSALLVAKFIKNDHYVTVKTNHSEAGEVTASQFVSDGGSMVIQASAKKGWQFEGWQENNTYISRDVKFNLSNIKTDRNITAIFSKTQFKITLGVNPSDCGKVASEGMVQKGFDYKIKAEPYDGYVFTGWTYNGNLVSKDAEFTIRNVTQDYYVVANFEKKGVKSYTINAGVCSNDGVISPSGDSKVQEGGSILYTITPKSGYRVLAVAVDNVQVGAVTSYSFTNVKSNHTIAVAFTPLEKAVAASSNTHTDVVKKGSISQTDTITPEEAMNPDVQPIVEDISEDTIDQGEGYDYDSQEGIVQVLNMTIEEATDKNLDKFRDVMREALYDGILQVAIFDEYDRKQSVGASGDFINSQALPNLENVIDSLLTKEDLEDIVRGNPIKFNVNIFDNSKFITDIDKKAIDSTVNRGVTIGNYFEILFMKSKDGECHSVTETPIGMKVCLDIPADLKDSGRSFYIVRAHITEDGSMQLAVLPDEDSDPNTVTFTTDKFSSYAIAYQGGESSKTKQIVIVILYAAIAVLVLMVLLAVGRSAAGRRHKRG